MRRGCSCFVLCLLISCVLLEEEAFSQVNYFKSKKTISGGRSEDLVVYNVVKGFEFFRLKVAELH